MYVLWGALICSTPFYSNPTPARFPDATAAALHLVDALIRKEKAQRALDDSVATAEKVESAVARKAMAVETMVKTGTTKSTKQQTRHNDKTHEYHNYQK